MFQKVHFENFYISENTFQNTKIKYQFWNYFLEWWYRGILSIVRIYTNKGSVLKKKGNGYSEFVKMEEKDYILIWASIILKNTKSIDICHDLLFFQIIIM